MSQLERPPANVKRQQFLDAEWDCCLVLDACRYDVFSEVYEDYLDGTLEKRWSRGSSTPEWAFRTFTGTHDIAYFSGNPFINSLEIPLNELKWGASCDYEWTAASHISDIIDVWQEGWDEDVGTVPPESLETSYRSHGAVVDDAERTVLHYMQPHAPYLSRGKGGKLTQIRKGIRRQAADEGSSTGSNGALSSLGDNVRRTVERGLDQRELAQKAGMWIELGPGELLKHGTRDAALDLYEENLRLALEAVADLIPELDGRVVVTADHGEAFGEDGVWEHHIETYIPPLMEVPWLEVR